MAALGGAVLGSTVNVTPDAIEDRAKETYRMMGIFGPTRSDFRKAVENRIMAHESDVLRGSFKKDGDKTNSEFEQFNATTDNQVLNATLRAKSESLIDKANKHKEALSSRHTAVKYMEDLASFGLGRMGLLPVEWKDAIDKRKQDISNADALNDATFFELQKAEQRAALKSIGVNHVAEHVGDAVDSVVSKLHQAMLPTRGSRERTPEAEQEIIDSVTLVRPSMSEEARLGALESLVDTPGIRRIGRFREYDCEREAASYRIGPRFCSLGKRRSTSHVWPQINPMYSIVWPSSSRRLPSL